jgi:hypothetical protein
VGWHKTRAGRVPYPPRVPSPPRPGEAGLADLTARLAADVERVEDRVRGLSLPRLARALPPYGTVADAARRVAQLLADCAQGVEERERDVAPRWRELPRLPDHVVGDQVAVTGRDAVAALRGVDDGGASVWTRAGRRPVTEVAAEVLAAMRETRLAID